MMGNVSLTILKWPIGHYVRVYMLQPFVYKGDLFACSVIVYLDLLFFFSLTVSPPPLLLWSLNFHKPLLLHAGQQEPFWSLVTTMARMFVMFTLPLLPLRQR
ncbi:hypothetical protein BGW37DRAFT_502084 [Umbelopsis sp. PMI_123]|nr:hypothetical protein BGW37DRAFT_502084 [Umbelopsis sp. PMI_123]